MATKERKEELDVLDQFKSELLEDLEGKKQELADIELKINQSEAEINKLTQKNASATGELQQLQNQLDKIDKAEIKKSYDNALDAQQRLFMMRRSLEKIQNDRVRLQEYVALIEHVFKTLNDVFPPGAQESNVSTTAETIEMIIQAQEAERQRLSRQMHDGPAQALSNFILQTEIAMRLFDIDQQRAKDELVNLRNSATTAFQQVRDFIFALRPMMLDDLGLAPTLKRYVDVFKTQPGAVIDLKITGRERRLEPYLEVMVFRAIQELLGNALRHSQATEVKVHLDMGDVNLKVSVDDNGKGFEFSPQESRGGMGLKVIKERIEMLGGEFEVDSVIDQGTRITIQIPAREAARLS